jgi:diaminopimelate decarboxylase
MLDSLRGVVSRFGTPTYAYDCDRLQARVEDLKRLLPAEVGLLYSLKANASLGLCELMARWGLGADVASVGELVTALEAGFPADRIQVGGPSLSDEILDLLGSMPQALVSVDSADQLRRLSLLLSGHRAILRLRPDFPCAAAVSTGEGSRFGIPLGELGSCIPNPDDPGLRIVGFHVYCGSQVLDLNEILRQLRGGLDLCLRASRQLGIQPEILNLGGGFGTPYSRDEPELDLEAIGRELHAIVEQARPARVVLELGRYLIAPSGWYLTTVMGQQTVRGQRAVVVDGGVHQLSDLCGIGRRARGVPPLVLGNGTGPTTPTHVLGNLCLPDDVLAECCPLPSLSAGDVLAFPNAGAYGLAASPYRFLGHPAPAEVAFTGTESALLRARESGRALLDGQARLMFDKEVT